MRLQGERVHGILNKNARRNKCFVLVVFFLTGFLFISSLRFFGVHWKLFFIFLFSYSSSINSSYEISKFCIFRALLYIHSNKFIRILAWWLSKITHCIYIYKASLSKHKIIRL